MNSFEKLKAKLAELFQLDQADLDFGIYRIMNARRDEINRFLESDLLPQVREAFEQYDSADKTVLKKELEEAKKQASDLGVEPDSVPKVKELRTKYETSSVDVTALENEVYDHLYSFFSRYYDEGDFISLRRYKEGVYAIPYEGEEVKLHWANHDQYYIKTTEYFRDYAFKTPSGHRVHFKIVEADTEKDNTKAANGNNRRFLLHGDKPVVEENGKLVIRFEYRPDGEKRRQDAINVDTAKRVIADLNDEKLAVWKDRLSVMWKRADSKESDKTILDKHLFDYTRRNTFDYFIHKDLGGFLRRELDFYIKNEVMRLDDIEEESAPRVEQYLSKIKVIRRIAHKIIDFLAQIENFQKKLWLKKKFVVETNYCMTLDRVPEELYPEIAANDAQREEWVRLFAIDEIRKDLIGAVDYSEPLTVEFLKANPFLMLDTKFFGQELKDRLLANFDDIGRQCDGLLVHSDNLQTLRLLKERYQGQVRCTYIDPPYNTGGDGFVYKDSYQHSSWLSMIRDRVAALLPLASRSAVFFASIDDNELVNFRSCLDMVFGGSSFETQIIVQSNKRGQTYQSIAKTHEYLLVYSVGSNAEILELPKDIPDGALRDSIGPYELWELRNRNPKFGRHNRPNLYYPVYVAAEKVDKDGYAKVSLTKEPSFTVEVFPKNSAGEDSCWRWGKEKSQQALSEGDLRVLVAKQKRDGGWNVYQKARKGSRKAKSIWTETGVINEQGTVEVGHLGLSDFGFPKPTALLQKAVQIGATDDSIVLDYFAGSGTTGHAVINLNRDDGGARKYILVEVGDYFDTVIMPRIQKVVYSTDWKDGKPVSRDGVSHMFKYIRLESYEDALANIELQRTGPQQLLLDRAGDFRESYMLKYVLDVESRGSQTLLNIDNFDDPWNYKLLVGADSVGETRPVNVDLVETFNWLLGLKVMHIDRIGGFQVVEGENPKGEKVLVIWRKVRDLDETDIEKIAAAREKANRDLETFFRKQQYNTLDSEFDVVYVNGDNNLMNVPLDPDKEGVEPRYKVRLIEEEFKRLMFDVKDI
jgi:adenine-specific DNA-methyltransferase